MRLRPYIREYRPSQLYFLIVLQSSLFNPQTKTRNMAPESKAGVRKAVRGLHGIWYPDRAYYDALGTAARRKLTASISAERKRFDLDSEVDWDLIFSKQQEALKQRVAAMKARKKGKRKAQNTVKQEDLGDEDVKQEDLKDELINTDRLMDDSLDADGFSTNEIESARILSLRTSREAYPGESESESSRAGAIGLFGLNSLPTTS